jgi:hypothetical protein
MGRLSAELYPAQLADRCNDPRLTRWSAWAGGARAEAAAARRLAAGGLDVLAGTDPAASRALLEPPRSVLAASAPSAYLRPAPSS